MRTMTISETREISGGWKVKCPICNKNVNVSFWDWLFSTSTKSSMSNYHAFGMGKKH